MFRKAMAAAVVMAGVLFAADGVVVKLDGEKLTVKVDGKDRVIELKGKRPHVHGADGKHLKPEQYKDALKEGVKVEIEEEKGTVIEITVKEVTRASASGVASAPRVYGATKTRGTHVLPLADARPG